VTAAGGSRLRAHDEVPLDDLPTLAGVVTAAALGLSPANWRQRIGGKVSPSKKAASVD